MWVSSCKETNMGKESNSIRMVQYMMVNGSKEEKTGMVNCLSVKTSSTKAVFKRGWKVVMEGKCLKMETSIMEGISMENSKDRVSIYGRMDLITKGYLKMAWEMEREFGGPIINLAMLMRDSISRTWSMGLESINGPMAQSTREGSKMIWNTEKGLYTTRMGRLPSYSGKVETL